MARLAITAFGGRVGGRSTSGWSKTRLSIARLGASVDITRLQVPPRPPKRQSKGCLFFCQSILAKTVITPDFLRKNRKPGAFCFVKVILICLQLFLPIFPNPVGDMAATSAAEGKKGENFEKMSPFGTWIHIIHKGKLEAKADLMPIAQIL